MENKIPTAEKLLKLKETFDINHPTVSISDAIEAMIAFAKLHVEAALEEASKKAKLKHNYHDEVYDSNYCDKVNAEFCSLRTDGDGIPYGADLLNIDKKSILNSYPLTNIK